MRILQSIIFLSFVYYSSGANLTCYICNPCSEPFDASSAGRITKPDGDQYYCSKIWTGIYVKRDMERICIEGNLGGIGKWCCRDNLCNDASSFVLNPFIWISMIIFHWLKKT